MTRWEQKETEVISEVLDYLHDIIICLFVTQYQYFLFLNITFVVYTPLDLHKRVFLDKAVCVSKLTCK